MEKARAQSAILVRAFAGLLVAALAVGGALYARAQDSGDFTAAKAQFDNTCAACHGEGATGGDRAPALIDNPDLRVLDENGIAAIIRAGTPRGMPAFASLAGADVARLAGWIHSMNRSGFAPAPPEQVAAGERFFFGEGKCGTCHMVRGQGGSSGPDLSNIAARATRAEIDQALDEPTARMGVHSLAACPRWVFCPDFQWAVVDVTLTKGGSLRGFARNRTEHELQLQTLDGKLHLLDAGEYSDVKQEPQSFMPKLAASPDRRHDLLAYLSSLSGIAPGPIDHAAPVTPADIARIAHPKAGEWSTYNGSYSANRYSPLAQINTANVKQLQPQFLFSPGGAGLEGTPLVIDGMMYLTGGAQVCAINARTGARLWCAVRDNGLASGKGKSVSLPAGPNRGVAVLGDRVFYISDDAYLVCLNRLTGAVMWSEWLPEKGAEGKFYSSAAPLIVNDLVIAGVAGGDTPMRGFLAAFHPDTGKQAWRFYTIPKPGEPLSETWIGRALTTGGGATWETGSYDPETGTLYWAVGNPFPDTDPDERGGTNLYTNSVIALDAATGKFKWHFQFTPYDTHDWDATQPYLLVDALWHGKPRKLLLSAQRSGIFYVLDRATGEFLLAKPFVRQTWASGFNKDGSPIMVPGQVPTVEGVKTCPGVRGATNWYATAFDPKTRLFYVMAAEDCGIYRKSGNIFGNNPDPKQVGTRLVRALNIETGDVAWEKKLIGPQETNYTGVLATAGGLLFHGETGGDFAAVDSKTGKTLWTFRSNDSWRASPMTYSIGGRQYVAGMDGTNLISFALGYK